MTGSDQAYSMEDISVLDLSTFVTGGFATMMLANQGADVVKVERPHVGDDIRHSGPPFADTTAYDGPGRSATEEGESPYFWTVNYGKRSIELNLKSDAGRDTFYDLAKEADVIVENFRPGTADRLGIGYETINELNDQIVYCSISGFGDDGPWRDRPGYDMLIQGMSGIMSVTGEPDRPPVKVGMPVTDLITAMWAAFGIMNGLFRRERIGTGDHIELGMLDAAIPWLTKQAAKATMGETPERMGTKDPVLAPYQMFPTADGHMNVACGNQRLWESLCDALDRSDLKTDERFRSNGDRVEHMDELESELSAEFEQRPTAEWVDELAEKRELPVGPVFDVSEALENEQINARGVLTTLEHPAIGDIPVIEHPLNYRNATAGFRDPPPLLGEDTADVLAEHGYDRDQIRTLYEQDGIPETALDTLPDI